MEHAFANILLTGPCNLRCADCIGRQVRTVRRSTLDTFPLPGLDSFAAKLASLRVHQVSITGIDTEPLLYRHTSALLSFLRHRIAHVELSLHTNGRNLLTDLQTVHLYDRATISLPSLDPETCRRMTGSTRVLDLSAIRKHVRIPVKLSILMTTHNRREIPSLLLTARNLGFKRIVLRRRYHEPSPYNPLCHLVPTRHYGGNPVYDMNGLEVTVWDFDSTRLPCLNLMPDGSCQGVYSLMEAAHG